MKDNQGTMVLSGVLTGAINKDFSEMNKTILEYTNVLDISKAWRVMDYKVWLKSNYQDIGIANYGNMSIRTQLNTDHMDEQHHWDAGENRAIAFSEHAYAFQAYISKEPFTLPVPNNYSASDYYVQPDHVIQNQLDISAQVFMAEAGGLPVELNYIIYLEEVKITPIESIVFNIKSKAQDIEN